MELNGAQLLVEGMKLEGAEYVFGMSATATLPVLDVVYNTSQIQYIQSQHEQGAIYMANGHARANGKVSFCLVGPGPGTTNCQSGMAQAFYTSVPSILIGIEDGSDYYGLGFALHHGLDAVGVMKPVTKLSIRAERTSRLADLIRMACRLALSPRNGPAYLSVPRNLLDEKACVDLVPPEHYRVATLPAGNFQEIARAAGILAEAKNPVALAAGEVEWHGAREELIKLAELLGMPVAGTEGHKGIFPEDHPLGLGVTGIHGRPYAHRVFQEADVILALGTAFTEFGTGWFGHKVIPKNVKIIQIDVEASEMGKIYPIEMGIAGDIKAILQSLIGELRERKNSSLDWREIPRIRELQSRKSEWEMSIRTDETSSRTLIHPLRLMKDLRAALPDDALVVGQSGSTQAWFEYGFTALTHNLGIGTWHPMGAEYSETLGAQLATPERTVVCVLGDGSMMMALPELATAVKYNIPVLAVVFHNDIFGKMHRTQVVQYGSRFIGTELPIPHLANVAKEFGAYGEKVVHPEDIKPAVKRALSSGKPSLLEVMVDNSMDCLAPPHLA
ncbi:MAG: thiamine pyrophosphate-binding protein [Deltaproteobacteria bacterium]|nr:thiamine pyrophosphate-binding protein [Deltaproteobacteria bacterium]